MQVSPLFVFMCARQGALLVVKVHRFNPTWGKE